MGISDWVLVCSTLFLGACALFVPYFAEIIKRKVFAPKVEIQFQLSPPFCHKTWLRSPQQVPSSVNEPVYYFRFRVTNRGKSRANNCEVCLENLWIYDSSQTPILYPNFSTINMAWSGNHSKQFVDVNPEKKMYCDIGHISSEEYQNAVERNKFIDIHECSGNELRFMIELPKYFFSQPNCLAREDIYYK